MKRFLPAVAGTLLLVLAFSFRAPVGLPDGPRPDAAAVADVVPRERSPEPPPRADASVSPKVGDQSSSTTSSAAAAASDNDVLPFDPPQTGGLVRAAELARAGSTPTSFAPLLSPLPPVAPGAARPGGAGAGQARVGGFVRRAQPPSPNFTPSGGGSRVTQAEVDALRTGLSQTLTALENSVVTEVFGETFPLVGNNIQVAWTNGLVNFRYLTKLRGAILSGLAGLTNAADYSPSQVSTPINSRLTSSNVLGSSVVVTTDNDQAQLTFVTADTFTAGSVPLEQNLGLPNLDFQFTGSPTGLTTANWTNHFKVGVDGAGFYLETAGSRLNIHTTTTIAALNAAGRFTVLPYSVTDNTASAATRTSIPLNFNVSLVDPGGGRIRPNQLSNGGAMIDATVTGSTKLALKLTSSVASSAMFPQVGTDLNLIWVFNAAPLDPRDNNATFGNRPNLSLDNNRINLESFFDNFAGRALAKIDEITEPLQPVIDALTFAIPLLSDLGSDDVTILDLFGVDAATVDAIGGMDALLDLANTAASFSDNAAVFTDLGNYTLQLGDPRVETLDDIPGSVSRPPSSTLDPDLVAFLADASGIGGLRFPVLTNAQVVANILLGREATLFTYRSGEFGFDEQLGPLFFPVLGPVGVTLGGHIGMKTEFGFGYDTKGIIDFGANNFQNPDLLFNGLYAMALDETNGRLTGIELSFGVTAGVEANVVVASVGVEGDLTATIGFYLDDLKGDANGRVRGNTIASLPVDELFYAVGQLSAGLRAYLEIGWPPFGVEFEFESPRVVILNFDSRGSNVPVLAEPGQDDPNELVLNTGDRANRRIHGQTNDVAEEFLIFSNNLGLHVAAFGHTNTFGNSFNLIKANTGLRGDPSRCMRTWPSPSSSPAATSATSSPAAPGGTSSTAATDPTSSGARAARTSCAARATTTNSSAGRASPPSTAVPATTPPPGPTPPARSPSTSAPACSPAWPPSTPSSPSSATRAPSSTTPWTAATAPTSCSAGSPATTPSGAMAATTSSKATPATTPSPAAWATTWSTAARARTRSTAATASTRSPICPALCPSSSASRAPPSP